MSRIGKTPVNLPKEVDAKFVNNIINIVGPKGELSFEVKNNIKINIKDNEIIISRLDDSRQQKSMHGTIRQLINNMIIGVSEGFKKELTIV